jgi:hypothetical protein
MNPRLQILANCRVLRCLFFAVESFGTKDALAYCSGQSLLEMTATSPPVDEPQVCVVLPGCARLPRGEPGFLLCASHVVTLEGVSPLRAVMTGTARLTWIATGTRTMSQVVIDQPVLAILELVDN